jgi:hypothetical protein
VLNKDSYESVLDAFPEVYTNLYDKAQQQIEELKKANVGGTDNLEITANERRMSTASAMKSATDKVITSVKVVKHMASINGEDDANADAAVKGVSLGVAKTGSRKGNNAVAPAPSDSDDPVKSTSSPLPGRRRMSGDMGGAGAAFAAISSPPLNRKVSAPDSPNLNLSRDLANKLTSSAIKRGEQSPQQRTREKPPTLARQRSNLRKSGRGFDFSHLIPKQSGGAGLMAERASLNMGSPVAAVNPALYERMMVRLDELNRRSTTTQRQLGALHQQLNVVVNLLLAR